MQSTSKFSSHSVQDARRRFDALYEKFGSIFPDRIMYPEKQASGSAYETVIRRLTGIRDRMDRFASASAENEFDHEIRSVFEKEDDIIVPLVWIKSLSERNMSKSEHATEKKMHDAERGDLLSGVTWKQAKMDFERDSVRINGGNVLNGALTGINIIVGHVARHIDWLSTRGKVADEKEESKIVNADVVRERAKDILRMSSRTVIGGDSIDTIYTLFRPPPGFHVAQDRTHTSPINITVKCGSFPGGWGLGVSVEAKTVFILRRTTSDDINDITDVVKIECVARREWLLDRASSGGGVVYVSLIERTSETSDTDSSKLDDEGAQKTEERIRGGEDEEHVEDAIEEIRATKEDQDMRIKRIRAIEGPSPVGTGEFEIACADAFVFGQPTTTRQPRRLVMRNIISGTSQISSVVCGARHCVAVSVLGVCFTWGNGRTGALGHGNFEDVAEPKVVEHFIELTPPASILRAAVGYGPEGSHSAVISADGSLFCWGVGPALATGHTSNLNIPRLVDEESIGEASEDLPLKVACGGCFTLVATTGGSLYAWGKWARGRLGLGSPLRIDRGRSRRGKVSRGRFSKYLLRPRRVVMPLPDARCVVVAAGMSHALTADSKGRLYAWGAGNSGQLGLGTTVDQLLPRRVHVAGEMDTSVVICDVRCGRSTSAALDIDGRVYTWGGGGIHALGRGLPTISLSDRAQLLQELRGERAGHPSDDYDSGETPKEPPMPSQACMDWTVPHRVRALDGMRVARISCGDEMMAVATDVGKLYTWGINHAEENVSASSRHGLPRLFRRDASHEANITRVREVSCGGKAMIFVGFGTDIGQDLLDELDRCAAHVGATGSYGLCDVTVFASGRPVYAHRVILTRSPTFRNMIEESWRGPARHTELLLPDLSYDVVRNLVRFIYADNLPTDSLNASLVADLASAADRFGLPRLSAICRSSAGYAISLSNGDAQARLDSKTRSIADADFASKMQDDMIRSLGDDGAPFVDILLLPKRRRRLKASSIGAHRVVLCARSAYFRAMLASSFDADDGGFGSVLEVVLPDSEAALRVAVHFMYTGTLPPIFRPDDDDKRRLLLLEVMVAADRYEMYDLLEECESAFVCLPQNAAEALRASNALRARRLKATALNALAKHISLLSSDDTNKADDSLPLASTLARMRQRDPRSLLEVATVMRQHRLRRRGLNQLREGHRRGKEDDVETDYRTNFPTRTFLFVLFLSGIYTVTMSQFGVDDYLRRFIPVVNVASMLLLVGSLIYSWRYEYAAKETNGDSK